MSYHQHGYPWPSPTTSPYHSSLLAGLQGYIPYPHIAAACMFELVILFLLGHMRRSIGVVVNIEPLYILSTYIYIYIHTDIYIFFFFIMQRVKACVIPCPHQPPTMGDNTVSVAQGGTATPGATKQLLPPDRVLRELYIYIYIYIYMPHQLKAETTLDVNLHF